MLNTPLVIPSDSVGIQRSEMRLRLDCHVAIYIAPRNDIRRNGIFHNCAYCAISLLAQAKKYHLRIAQISLLHSNNITLAMREFEVNFMKKIGVVGIVLKGDKAVAVEMQKVLSDFADIIVGRMGVPRQEANAIALIVEGSQERISALTGKLGRFESLSVKSAITAFELSEE